MVACCNSDVLLLAGVVSIIGAIAMALLDIVYTGTSKRTRLFLRIIALAAVTAGVLIYGGFVAGGKAVGEYASCPMDSGPVPF